MVSKTDTNVHWKERAKLQQLACMKLFRNFMLIFLIYCTFAYYIKVCMFDAVLQLHIIFANMPHVSNNSTF